MELPNRPLSPDELRELKRIKALERAENELDRVWHEQSQVPAAWFGRLVALGVVCFGLDTVGWVAAFLSPRTSYYLSLFLKVSVTTAIVGIAALAILGTIQGYQHEKAKKLLRETFVLDENEA